MASFRKTRADDPSDSSACYDAAIRLLQYRWRGEEELRRRLLEKEYVSTTVESTIERLREEKWIDDVRFATEMARGKSKKFGSARIERDLRRFGVGKDAIRKGIAEFEHLEHDVLERLGRRKLAVLRGRGGNEAVEPGVLSNKVAAFLMQRGFPAEDVYRLRTALREELEREIDENE